MYNERNLLLYGPPGVGKSTLARIIAGETGYAFIEYCASDFVQVYVGSGSLTMDRLLKKAIQLNKPVIIFIDELDALTEEKKNAGSREYTNTARSFWKKIDVCEKDYPQIFFIAAANDYKNLDRRIRERFIDASIKLSLPNKNQRIQIIKLHVKNFDKEISHELCNKVARWTRGWSGRELQRMVKFASRNSAGIGIKKKDFVQAYMAVQKHRPGLLDGTKDFFKNHGMTILQVSSTLLSVAGIIMQNKHHKEQMSNSQEIAAEQMAQSQANADQADARSQQQLNQSRRGSYLSAIIAAVSLIKDVTPIIGVAPLIISAAPFIGAATCYTGVKIWLSSGRRSEK